MYVACHFRDACRSFASPGLDSISMHFLHSPQPTWPNHFLSYKPFIWDSTISRRRLRTVLSAALRRQYSPHSVVCCFQKTVLSAQCCLLLSEDSTLRAVLSAALRRQYSPRSAVCCSQKTAFSAQCCLLLSKDSTVHAVLSAALRRQYSPRSAVCCSQKTVFSAQCCLLLSEDSTIRFPFPHCQFRWPPNTKGVLET